MAHCDNWAGLLDGLYQACGWDPTNVDIRAM